MIALTIPTKNRPERLRQALGYYADAGFTGGIFVVDSSDDSEVRKLCQRYKDRLLIHYAYAEATPICHATQVGTQMAADSGFKYALNAGDDDFAVVPGVMACVDFLESNPEYGGALGGAFHFTAVERSNRAQVRCLSYNNQDVDDPVMRVRAYLASPPTLQLGVYRVERLVEAYEGLPYESNLDTFLGFEMPANAYIAARSRAKHLPVLQFFFRTHPEGTGTPLGWANVKSPLFSQHLQRARNHICKALELEGCLTEEAKTSVDHALMMRVHEGIAASVAGTHGIPYELNDTVLFYDVTLINPDHRFAGDAQMVFDHIGRNE